MCSITEREAQLADALHRIVDRCTWRLSKKPSKQREGSGITLENIHEIATEALRSPLAEVPSDGINHDWLESLLAAREQGYKQGYEDAR